MVSYLVRNNQEVYTAYTNEPYGVETIYILGDDNMYMGGIDFSIYKKTGIFPWDWQVVSTHHVITYDEMYQFWWGGYPYSLLEMWSKYFISFSEPGIYRIGGQGIEVVPDTHPPSIAGISNTSDCFAHDGLRQLTSLFK
jgi:hypothetical protein